MTGTLRVRRSRGALSGVLLVLLGLWGALIPFIGPYFHYAYTPNRTWDFTAGRFWLELLPGLAVLAGGVIVLISRLRLVAVLGAWLAAAGGAWFAVCGLVALHWTRLPSAGTPVGGPARMLAEQVGFFTGLGVVIAFVAGLAMGRFTVVAARDLAVAEPAASPQAAQVPVAASESLGSTLLPRLTLPRPLLRSGSGARGSGRESGAAGGAGSD